MFRLRTLGTLDLRADDEGVVGSVLHQPKRFALLAYLALAGPGAFRRRDTLLGLFWPELDEAHARNALSQALSFLRRSLGDGVLVTRGTEELGVDDGRLWCDAVAFVRAAEAGELEEASELYRGELLEGLFVSEAPEWERWLEAERARLRGRAVAVAWTFAEREEEADNPVAAAHWGRRATTLAPLEEAGVRRMMALLDRTGDRAGAVRAYETFARRLADELEMEPAAEVRALAEEIRRRARDESASENAALARTNGMVAVAEPASAPARAFPAPAEEVLAPSPAPAGEAPAGTPVRDPTPHRPAGRRPLLVALAGVVLVASLVLTIGSVLSPDARPDASVSASRVAVLPFSFHGSAQFSYLAEGMVSLLATNLNGAGALRSVEPRALLSAVSERGESRISPERADALATSFGAGLYVVGDIVEAGGRLRITASLYDGAQRGEAGGRLLQQAATEGDASRLFALVDDLSRQLLTGWTDLTEPDLTGTAARTTHSLPALKAYFEGEQAMRAGRHAEAVEAFRRATEADSSFALAHYRLSRAANWINQDILAREAAEAAVRHSERLEETDRLLVMGWNHFIHGVAVEAERLYSTVLAVQPDNVEAWYELGEILFHWKPALGHSVAEARPAFQQVLRYQPNNADALLHLARIAARERNRTEFDSLAGRIAALTPDADRALEIAALRAFTFGDTAAQARIVTAASGEDWASRQDLVRAIAVYAQHLAGAERVAHAPIALDWRPDERAYHGLFRTHLALARGRWRAANAELDAVEPLQPWWAAQQRAGLAMLPLLPLGRAERDSLRAALLRIRTHRGLPPPYPSAAAHQLIYEPRQLYLLGALSLRNGDTAAALALPTRLDTLHGTPHDTAFGRAYARTLRADVARAQGRPREALAALGQPQLAPDGTLPELFGHAEAYGRWLRAELLRELGREQEALQWYASFPDPTGYDVIYLAPSHLRRAEIYEKKGDRPRAAEHYRRFLALWRDADPELQPTVALAGQRLQRRARGHQRRR